MDKSWIKDASLALTLELASLPVDEHLLLTSNLNTTDSIALKRFWISLWTLSMCCSKFRRHSSLSKRLGSGIMRLELPGLPPLDMLAGAVVVAATEVGGDEAALSLPLSISCMTLGSNRSTSDTEGKKLATSSNAGGLLPSD